MLTRTKIVERQAVQQRRYHQPFCFTASRRRLLWDKLAPRFRQKRPTVGRPGFYKPSYKNEQITCSWLRQKPETQWPHQPIFQNSPQSNCKIASESGRVTGGERNMAEFPETRVSLILRLAEPEDVRAWQEFAGIYGPALYRLALRRGLQSADAEDVAQEILFAVARAIERFQPDPAQAKFRTWLSRIARNLLADFCAGRAKRPLTQLVSDSWLRAADLSATSEAGEDFDHEFRTAIFQLAANRVRERVTADTWSAFELTAIQRQSPEQVASQLSMAVGTVYVARCRVLKLLRGEVEQLEQRFGEDATVESLRGANLT